MAFCANCGRKLDDGEICNCLNNNKDFEMNVYDTSFSDESPAVTNIVPETKEIKKTHRRSLFVAMLINMWGLFIAMVKNPVSAGKSFLKARDTKMAYFMFAIHAVVVVVYALITGIRKITERSVIYFIEMDTVSSGTGEVVRGVIVSLLVTAMITFGVACMAYVFAKALNGKTAFKNMLCLSGLNSLLLTPFIILATVLSFVINTYIIFAVAIVLSALVLLDCFDAVCEINENRKVYTVFCTYALLIVVIRIILMIISFMSVY